MDKGFLCPVCGAELYYSESIALRMARLKYRKKIKMKKERFKGETKRLYICFKCGYRERK